MQENSMSTAGNLIIGSSVEIDRAQAFEGAACENSCINCGFLE